MGIVSRVALPDLKTPSTFEKVRLPSGVTDPGRKPGVSRRGVSASLSIAIFRPGNRPPVTVMMAAFAPPTRSEEHTSELQSRGHLVCRLLLEKKKKKTKKNNIKNRKKKIYYEVH